MDVSINVLATVFFQKLTDVVISDPGLWYIGGALGHARYYSRYIALHVKADTMGHPLPVYVGNPHRIH